MQCERKEKNRKRCTNDAEWFVNFTDPNTDKSPILIYCGKHADMARESLQKAGIPFADLKLQTERKAIA